MTLIPVDVDTQLVRMRLLLAELQAEAAAYRADPDPTHTEDAQRFTCYLGWARNTLNRMQTPA
ncbi:uncharacterized protein RMCC_2469 [Mycolicibacterium canariasense]|uniref:Uncharacterized protein n=1 Tax=Mycolicibacterium canariasense TaxID=228230 RepID=A0A100WCI9_MYCCR|nr:hypothetical protein [Mycolicibacterium canariasense]MCV7212633.1 hypothetical protein [Mycolicibacterium canariasense]ORV02526.1 hypothetical protein AWB94_00880 [Mycolicibacterium canariasense]GAS95503.1 uncharacterized protein RMCC_2469 [Mycolicibacterium canariasense]